MARADVYRLADGSGLVLDVQSELLDPFNTRVVVPLMKRTTAPRPARGLNPVFLLGDEEYILVSQFLSAVPVAALGVPIGSLAAHQDQITRALDMVFQGV
ncbi:MAG: CcdB family protein [Maritimibacter sp.]